jgi:VWFA-related protein
MRLVLLALLAVPAVLFAQQKFEEKVTVTYVEVPVTVLGKDGKPVRGLAKENFEIYDDGAKRVIESFDTIDFAAQPARAISPLNPASRRNFLLLFDVSYASPTAMDRAQEAARNFIARSSGRRDLMAVAAIDVERGFRFLTAFTTDRELLKAAISDPRSFRAFDPLQISGVNPLQPQAGEPGAAVNMRAEGRSEIAEMTADLARAMGQADDSYRRARVKRQVDTLGTIARSLRHLSGRKHVVLLSEGFDPKLVQGRAAAESAEQSEENTFIQRGELWKVDSDKRFGNTSTLSSLTMMAQEFKKADVVLHAVDIQGVRVQNDVRGGAKVNSNEGLFLLAGATGGNVFRNSNDITGDFDRLAAQHEVVYILGFRAPVGRAGQFHELKLRIAGAPGARVHHRGGYYDAGVETPVERSLTTAEVILNDIAQPDIEVASLVTAFPTKGANAQVPVILEISGPDLVKHARKPNATTDIFVYAFDEGGIVRDTLVQRIVLELARVGERLRGQGVKFYGTLSLPPGRYAVKSLVRIAENDRMGYQRVDIDVPDPGDVAVVQPLFFEPEGNWVMVKATSDENSKPPYPFVLDGESFIPAARAELRKGEPRLFAIMVHNVAPDEITFETAPDARLVKETRSAGTETTTLLFALERVPAGASELGVTVRKKGSTDERRVSVPIRVE